MVKCLECGLDLPRLQWTHFKYNCTGKFNNGSEYKKAYPDAKLVDETVAKSTAITLDNLIRKYGKEEGQKRWDIYRKKQAYSNTLEYKEKKYGWDTKKFNDYNSSRAVTLENLVKRYGEVKGTEKWKSYCEKQRYTNTLEYFEKKYGNEGIQKFQDYNLQKGKSSNPFFIMKKYKISFNEALSLLSKRNTPKFVSENEKLFIEYIEKKHNKEFKYTYKTKQFCIWSDELNSPLFYDAVDTDLMIAYEYNGDYWHCNPNIYAPNFFNSKVGKTAQEIWKRDQIKNNLILKRGFRLHVIWESDWVKGMGDGY